MLQTSLTRLGGPLSVSDMHHRIAQLCGPGQIDDLDIRRCNSICNLFPIILEISDLSRCVQNDLPTILHNPSQSWIITCTKLRKLPFYYDPSSCKHYISWPSDTGMILEKIPEKISLRFPSFLDEQFGFYRFILFVLWSFGSPIWSFGPPPIATSPLFIFEDPSERM